MGWKASLIIIENTNDFKDDLALLKAIGKAHYVFEEEVIFEDCIHPRDKSINIGYYNNNIIIADDFELTDKYLDGISSLELIDEEKELCELFPSSEIVSIACHSVVNYHAYSLIQNGEKVRCKFISADNALIEFGERTIEEELIYNKSIRKEGANFWKDTSDPGYEYTEDQMMEEFTFGFAARRLGERLDEREGELMNIKLKKYTKPSIFGAILSQIKNKR